MNQSNGLMFHTALVTGGGGFVGTHIIQSLRQRSKSCVIYSVSRNPKNHPIFDEAVRYEAADITNASQLAKVFERVQPQVVFHTVSPHASDSAKILHSVNVEGTRNLIAAAKACPATQALVYTSSDSALIPTERKLIEEEAQLYSSTDNVYPYWKTKALGEAMVLTANGEQLRTSSIRIAIVYGEYDYHSFSSSLIRTLKRNEQNMQVGPDEKLFEFVYAGKAAEAHILAANELVRAAEGAISDPERRVDGEAFFISDGRPSPMFEFARRCFAAAGKPVSKEEVKQIPLWAIQAMASVGEWLFYIFTAGYIQPQLRRQEIDHLDRGCNWNIEKAKARLGYKPIENQDGAIAETMKWSVENLMSKG